MFNFVTVGNDCSCILEECFGRLKELYPEAQIFLYDWGFDKEIITRLAKINSNLNVIKWTSANATNYMYEKVICIKDCYYKHHDVPLIYIDADVIIKERVDEVLRDDSWDIAATWRPEYSYRSSEFGVGAWLNAGVLFVNCRDVDSSKIFLQEWERRCATWQEKAWWLDQVELIKLFSLADQDLSRGPDLVGNLLLNDKVITLKTLHYAVYNFLPEMPEPYPEYNLARAKIIHLKSPWRKMKFKMLTKSLRRKWIENVNSEKKGSFCMTINYRLNSLIRLAYNIRFLITRLGRFPRVILRSVRREFIAWYYRNRNTEIYYWKAKRDKVGDLYASQIERSKKYLELFNNLNKVVISEDVKVMDIGTGPIGGILDLLECKEKWAVEPIYSQYKRKRLWCPRSDLIVRETVCEQLTDVPDDYFDLIFSMNALDHGENIELCFRKIYGALKKDGLFYFHVHCRKEAELNPLHRQAFSYEDLKRWLKSCGFQIISACVFEEDPVPTNKYNTFVGVMIKL